MTKDEIIRMAREAGLFTHKEVQPELKRLCKDPEVFETVKEGVRMIEAAHGIKEGT